MFTEPTSRIPCPERGAILPIVVASLVGAIAAPSLADPGRPIDRIIETSDIAEISARLLSPSRIGYRVTTFPGWYEFIYPCSPSTPMWVTEGRDVHLGMGGIGAADNEFGHWSAVELPLGHTPYDLKQVGYVLWDGIYQACPDCPDQYPSSADIPHRVQIFTATGPGEPPASPDVIVEFDVALAQTYPGWNAVDLVLDQPLRVHAGERLWVSIEMTGTVPDRLSLASCGYPDNQNWAWSFATTAPYSWDLLPYERDFMVWGLGDELY